MNFTQASVIAAAAKSTADEFIWDPELPGFGIRARGGRARYIVQYRIGKKQRRLTIENVRKISLVDARKRAREMFGETIRNVDPSTTRAKAKTAASKTFSDAVELFLSYQETQVSASWFSSQAFSLRERFKVLHGLALTDIDRATVASALRTHLKYGPVSTTRARSALSGFFTWAIGEGLMGDRTNPVDGTNLPKVNGSRERCLDHAEIRKIWRALDDSTTFGRCVKLLLLTGTRRCEIGDLRWSEVDLDAAVLHIPKERCKNGVALDVPLSAPAVEILKLCKRRNEFVFGITNGFTNWHKSKAGLDAELQLEPWTLHDLRRSADTIMSEELDVPPHIVAAILNHVSGARSAKNGVKGVYNLAKYLKPRREALDRYAAHILQIVGPAKPRLSVVAA